MCSTPQGTHLIVSRRYCVRKTKRETGGITKGGGKEKRGEALGTESSRTQSTEAQMTHNRVVSFCK